MKTRRRNELQRWLYGFKRDECRCERCGEGYPACLDFHHVGTKEDDVSRMVVYGYSRARIKDEMDRCIVLCANCHRKEHYELPLSIETDDLDGKRRRRVELRVWVYEYKQATDGCVRCDEDDPACLEFHHINEDEKTVSVGNLIAYGPSKKRLIEEIEKCEIPHRNCHRKEHYEVPEKITRDGETTA